jgi:hypothetical protein
MFEAHLGAAPGKPGVHPIRMKKPMHSNTGTQEHKNTGIQEYKNTRTQEYKNTGISRKASSTRAYSQ